MTKKIKITYGKLKSLLESSLLQEEDPAFPKDKKPETGSSIDAQVDRFLIQYEKEAKVKQESVIIQNALDRLLYEADELEDISEDAPEDDEKLSGESIDIENFANSVSRLVQNYDELLEIRNSIIRRASKFLNKNYDTEVVKTFQNAMKTQHGMSVGKSKKDTEEEFAAPPGTGAGPLSSGGGGGGVG